VTESSIGHFQLFGILDAKPTEVGTAFGACVEMPTYIDRTERRRPLFELIRLFENCSAGDAFCHHHFSNAGAILK
jgi:hypothetical protein